MKNLIIIVVSLNLAFGINLIAFPFQLHYAFTSIQEEEELLEEQPQEELKKEEELLEELKEEEEELKEEPRKKTEPKQEESEQIQEYQPELIEDAPPSESERMKYFKDKYEDNYEKTFEEVWQSVIKSLEDKSCQILKKSYSQTDEGFYKGTIVSDYCVFSLGKDTTFQTLKKYSVKVPVIRGGVWIAGRFQYKFIINERDDGTVHLLLNGEVSGFEEYVTSQVHFWESNGYMETMMMKQIRRNLQLPVN